MKNENFQKNCHVSHQRRGKGQPVVPELRSQPDCMRNLGFHNRKKSEAFRLCRHQLWFEALNPFPGREYYRPRGQRPKKVLTFFHFYKLDLLIFFYS